MQAVNYCAIEGHPTPRQGRPVKITQIIALGLCLFLLPAVPSSQAEFNLNFKPDEKINGGASTTGVSYSNNDAYVSCYISYLTSANCGNQISGSHDDASGFYQRMFQDTTTSKWYYQVIIGDYYAGDNFALEYIIEASSSYGSAYSGSIYRTASAYNGTTAFNTSNQLYNTVKPYDVTGSDSLKTGTGTGNPTKIIMNLFLKDADTEMAFLKDSFANKPLISQITKNGNTDNGGTYGAGFTGNATDMVSTVILDARALDHNSMSTIPVVATDTIIDFAAATGITAGTVRHTNVTKKAGAGITNTVTLGGAGIFGTAGDYNYAADNQHSNPTAGRYTYTAGTEEGGSNGTYTYVDAANGDVFNPAGINYADFCDPIQNPNWSGVGACKNKDGTGGGGGNTRGAGHGGGW